MTIDTLIDDLVLRVSSLGYATYSIPAEHVSSVTEASFVTITESDIEAESTEAYNFYILKAGIEVQIRSYASEHEEALHTAQNIRNAVITVLNTYTDHQILIQRITNTQAEKGHVQYTIECIVQLPLT